MTNWKCPECGKTSEGRCAPECCGEKMTKNQEKQQSSCGCCCC